MKFTKHFLLFALLAPCALVSCGEDSKVALVYGDQYEGLTEIQYGDLANKVDDEKTFLLAVRPKSNCTCWAHFKVILEEYKRDTHISVFTIVASEFDNATNKYGLDVRSDRETFAIFKNGKLYEQNVYSEKNAMFNQKKDFKAYLESRVHLPTMFYITLDTLDSWLGTQDKEFTVYFARNNCKDCEYLDNHALKEYGEKHLDMTNLYILDCESLGIRVYDENNNLTTASAEAWQKFKDNYKLSNKYSEDGYNTGYVPTFLNVIGQSSYVPGVAGEASYEEGNHDFIVGLSYVYFNDTLTRGEDGKIRVTDSFLSQERFNEGLIPYIDNSNQLIKGIEVPESDITAYGPYLVWNKPAAAKYHDKALNQYLDYVEK